jgi:hypothetical protein
MQRLGFMMNASVLYELGHLFKELDCKTILAYCSTNYVYNLSGFSDQLSSEGYGKQKAFPVQTTPVGLFPSAGEALANAFGVIDAPDPTDKALRRKTIYPATRYLGEYLLHEAAGPKTRLLTFRFPGFYPDVGVGTSNTVMTQLITTPAVLPEKLQTLRTKLDELAPHDSSNILRVQQLIQGAMDANAPLDQNLRWVVSSVDLANRMHAVIEKCIELQVCGREAMLINGEHPNVKSDWTLAGFIAFLAHQGHQPVITYLKNEARLQEEAQWRHLPVSTADKRSISPQHMFDDSIYPDKASVQGLIQTALSQDPKRFFLERREIGIKQMARNFAGMQVADVPGRRMAFTDASRYAEALRNIFHRTPT